MTLAEHFNSSENEESNAAHPGLRPFYDAMSNVHIGNNQSSGITIFVAVFWFGPCHQYNAVLVGPFGKGVPSTGGSQKYDGPG